MLCRMRVITEAPHSMPNATMRHNTVMAMIHLHSSSTSSGKAWIRTTTMAAKPNTAAPWQNMSVNSSMNLLSRALLSNFRLKRC